MREKGEIFHKRKDGRWEARYEKGRAADGAIIYGFLYGKSYREAKEKKLQAVKNQIQKKSFDESSCPIDICTLTDKWLESIHYTVKPQNRTFICAKSSVLEKDLLSSQQLSVLYDYLLLENTFFSLGILLCMHTGIRVGELCGIKSSDLNLETGILTIQRTVCRIRNLASVQSPFNQHISSDSSKTLLLISTPKTFSSRRQIPVPKHILDLLRQKVFPENTYLLTGTEKCLEPRTVQRRFKKILQNCELPLVTFHSLRHSFATKCIENGV